jgi:hypothetical protein
VNAARNRPSDSVLTAAASEVTAFAEGVRVFGIIFAARLKFSPLFRVVLGFCQKPIQYQRRQLALTALP